VEAFEEHLNELLVSVYRSIGKMEESMLKSAKSLDLSINEIHLLEAVGKHQESGCSISDLSQELDISLPSVTIAVGKLIKKGYLIKDKSQADGRMVHISLTERGAKVDKVHQYFHRKMVTAIAKDLTGEEKAALTKGMEKLSEFFEYKRKKMTP